MGVIVILTGLIEWESDRYSNYKDLPYVTDWSEWDLLDDSGEIVTVYSDRFYNAMVF